MIIFIFTFFEEGEMEMKSESQLQYIFCNDVRTVLFYETEKVLFIKVIEFCTVFV